MPLLRLLKPLATAALLTLGFAKGSHAADDQKKLWLANIDAREKYLEQTLGTVPRHRAELHGIPDAWRGGGVVVVPATKLGSRLAAYATSGLSNTDMPARAVSKHARKSAAAGYGYEILVVTAPDQHWPLNLLQQMVADQFTDPANLLEDVDHYDGMALQDIDLGEAAPFHYLIARARPPLPTGVQLPGGTMTFLVVTTITREERAWSMKHGRKALLDKLMEAGVGQTSKPGRDSVVR